MKRDQVVTGRIIKIDFERSYINISTKSDVLQDNQGLNKLNDDDYTNTALKQKVPYIKRVIAHENFQNVNFQEAVLRLNLKDQGDCIIRPSSKGHDHLMASCKKHTDIINHVDILESNKPNQYSLGETLIIGEEMFEDLDEIIVNYISSQWRRMHEIY